MFGLTLTEWLDILTLAALIGGGFWALYLYRTARRGQVRIGIQANARLDESFNETKDLLRVSILFTNSSGVLWRHESSIVLLLDARKLAEDGSVRFVPFDQRDPFLPVYGSETDDPHAMSAGETFDYYEGQEITLEPGEQISSEVEFPIDVDKLGLMGVKVIVQGRQRYRFSRPYAWATFFLVDPRSSHPQGTFDAIGRPAGA
jgi:hypothetical protein